MADLSNTKEIMDTSHSSQPSKGKSKISKLDKITTQLDSTILAHLKALTKLNKKKKES